MSDDTTNKAETDYALAGANEALKTNGYGFPFAVLRVAHELFVQGDSSWQFVASEFPVAASSGDTRIDFVLKHKNNPIYLLAECKRVNPAYSNWFFAQSPMVLGNRPTQSDCILECIDTSSMVMSYGMKLGGNYITHYYHINASIKSNRTGDKQAQPNDAIERACTQVMRGMNGFVDFAAKNTKSLFGDKTLLLPVIFTTANIWVTDKNLTFTDIETGDISLDRTDIYQPNWIAYQYHQSPGLKSYIPHRKEAHDIQEALENEYIRTVFIVNSKHIKPFLSRVSQEYFSKIYG